MLKEDYYEKILHDAEELVQTEISGVYGGKHLTTTSRERKRHQLRELKNRRLRYKEGLHKSCEQCGSPIDWYISEDPTQPSICSGCLYSRLSQN